MTGESHVLSVVIVGRDGLRSLHSILTCLKEQTIAHRIEVLAVAPRALMPDAPPDEYAHAFGDLRFIAVDRIGNRGRAAAAGVRTATAPVLAFTENHCFPDPDWAETLVAEYADGVAGVAPAVLNANPASVLSWAIYGAGYALFADAHPAREIGEMPMHNASYRRALLEPLDSELEELLSDERNLQARLKDDGARFLFRPAARTRHINEATWRLVLGLNWINGRRYGGQRAKEWSIIRRVAYSAAFPLLSINVLRATLKRLGRIGSRPSVGARLFLLIWAQSLAHTLGEAGGYLFGPRASFEFLDLEEFMILERIAGQPPSDPRLSGFVARAAPLLPSDERIHE